MAKTLSAKKKINGSKIIPIIDEKISKTEIFFSSWKIFESKYLSI